MSRVEAKWLDMSNQSIPRAHSVSVAIQLYEKFHSMERMHDEYCKLQRANREAWNHHTEWLKQIPSGVWPNGTPIEPPDRLLLVLKRTTFQREMKRAGISISKQKSRFRRIDIGTEWCLVPEKERGQGKAVRRYNVTHVHADGLRFISGHYQMPFGEEMGPIKLGSCLVCKAEMPRHIEAWIRMTRLEEKLG